MSAGAVLSSQTQRLGGCFPRWQEFIYLRNLGKLNPGIFIQTRVYLPKYKERLKVRPGLFLGHIPMIYQNTVRVDITSTNCEEAFWYSVPRLLEPMPRAAGLTACDDDIDAHE